MSDQPHDALHPAQNVGMALAFSRRAVEFLDTAAEQQAVILPRAVVESAIRNAQEIHDGEGVEPRARSIVDTLSFYVDT